MSEQRDRMVTAVADALTDDLSRWMGTSVVGNRSELLARAAVDAILALGDQPDTTSPLLPGLRAAREAVGGIGVADFRCMGYMKAGIAAIDALITEQEGP